jgi:hypothetical protein
MIQFFEWIASLNTQQAWGFFVLVCAAMAYAPYAGLSFRWIKLLISNEKPEILDFSWRVSSDHYLMSAKDKKYYLNAANQNFILEGGKLILNWHVKGAYRIDVLPVGKKLKGNTAVIAARRQQNEFKLIAYTTKGKLEKKLVLDLRLFRDLSTLNISKEDQFNQTAYKRNTTAFTTARTLHGRYAKQHLGALPFIGTKTLRNATHRMNYPKQISLMKAWYDREIWKAAQSRYFKSNHFHGVAFHPDRYNAAMRNSENEKLIS